MKSFSFVLLCSFIIFFATTLGSFFVYFIKKIDSKHEKICLGLASGIMFASSIWSLLIPSLESSNYIYVMIGFIIGIFIIIKLDKFVKKYSNKSAKKNTMLFLAMTIHNIPEGMTVGLVSTYAYINSNFISISAALALTIGIAIQNIPEGACLSLNYNQSGLSKFKSFILGFISGIVEPIGAIIMFLLFKYFSILLPFILSSASGIMIYVVVNELIPSSSDDSNIGSIYFMIGFLIMLSLDILL